MLECSELFGTKEYDNIILNFSNKLDKKSINYKENINKICVLARINSFLKLINNLEWDTQEEKNRLISKIFEITESSYSSLSYKSGLKLFILSSSLYEASISYLLINPL